MAARTPAEISGCCSAAWPVPTAAAPTPWPRGGLGQCGGTGFGATKGKLWLANHSEWTSVTYAVEQNVIGWAASQVLVNPVSYTGAGVTPVWIYIENACGMVTPLGLAHTVA